MRCLESSLLAIQHSDDLSVTRIEVESFAIVQIWTCCTSHYHLLTSRQKRTTSLQAVEDTNTVRERVLKSSTTNPALQRLQGRVLAGAQASEVITSYDRMHHRHIRS